MTPWHLSVLLVTKDFSVPNDYSVVRNDLGGIVGQLISDGVTVAIDNDLLVAPLELCIDIRDEVSRAVSYDVTAFGQLM